MVADRAHGQRQPLGDLLVAQARRRQGHDLPLPCGEFAEHQTGQRREHAMRQAAPEARRAGRELDRKIDERAALPRAFSDQQRLHQSDAFARILDHGR